MSRRWLYASAALAGLATLFARGAAPRNAPARPVGSPAAAAAHAPARLQGMAGCTARGCHGGPIGSGKSDDLGLDAFDATSANAATVWLRHDKHADAYRVLAGTKAEAMMKLLAGPGGTPRHAYQEERCLACHATPSAAAELAAHDTLQADGFTCEACHGAAEHWLTPHVTKSFHSRAGHDSIGLTRLNDPLSRAATCVGCHVGAPADEGKGLPLRDMNHDMIAAGHPRLTFEFASYLRSMPPHWQEKEPSKAGPFEDWLAGQQAGLEADLSLLADRAGRAANPSRAASDWRTGAPWPEFAEYDCYSCHRALSDRTPTAFEPDSGRPGGLVWNRWNWSWPLRQLTANTPLDRKCQELVKQVSQPYPNAGEVRQAALSARAAVGDLRAAPDVARELLITPKQLNERLLRWDDAAQLYYAWAALYAARPEDGSLGKNVLIEARNRLHFPARMDSPTQYRPVSFSGLKPAADGKP